MKCLLQRVRRNAWLVEISIFSLIYGVMIEVADDSPEPWQFAAGENLFTNSASFFIVAGIVTLFVALRAKTSFRSYISALSLITAAAVIRVLSVSLGFATSQIIFLYLGWLQVLLLQARLFAASYAYRDRRILDEHRTD